MDTEQKEQKKSKIRQVIWFLLRITIALGLIGYLVFAKKDELLEAFEKINYYWIMLALAFYATHMIAVAWRWKLLLDVQKIRLTFFESFSLTMQGAFFSLVIPGGAVGGDLVKVGLLSQRTPKGTRLEGALTILVDRIIGMTALFSIALVAALLSIQQILTMGNLLKLTIVALSAACIVGLAATLVIYFHRFFEKISIVSKCLSLADRLSKGMVTRLGNALDLYRGSTKTLLYCFLLSVIGCHLNLVLISIFILKGLNHALVPLKGFLFSIVFGLVAGVIPLTPSGLGTREFLMKNLLVMNGVGTGVETAIPLIFSSFVLSFSLIGGIFFIFQPKQKKSN